ncbi:MAG TPA: type II toxin-antitoxin system prevent-host-death family antitoxin [Rhodanobacteraceae bacterium]|nr:type II toxin-antitoxin system prevent-host-death family antitoxin [Rhodanobacteraceae bacterium]
METTVTLTELRQRLFQLADRVVESGEPLVIVRNGVRLRLVREDAPPEATGRLSRLVKRDIVIGPPLDPHESPAEWSGGVGKVAEPFVPYGARKKRPRSPRK